MVEAKRLVNDPSLALARRAARRRAEREGECGFALLCGEVRRCLHTPVWSWFIVSEPPLLKLQSHQVTIHGAETTNKTKNNQGWLAAAKVGLCRVEQ